MKPDLLITWIKHCDYPIFRATLRKYRSFFRRVIIYFSEHNRFPYYDHFLHDAMWNEEVLFLDPTFTNWSSEDWRNHATNEMLKHSDSEWVCSIEQDWFCKDWNNLLTITQEAMSKSDMTGWMNPTAQAYIHPAYWFIKRELLEKIGKDFRPHPEINGSDHFAMITYKAKELGVDILPIQEMRIKADLSTLEETDAFHLGGVNQNYLDFEQRFNSNVINKEEMFYVYNYWSMQAPIVQSPLFMETMKKMDERLRLKFEANGKTIGPEKSEWSKFF